MKMSLNSIYRGWSGIFSISKLVFND